ncbi:MAG: 3-deoxy-D-manno-octulosonic acid transferase [Deltaproteobacteria bacterium]|nr:3-deoxy-D-manno-octulosonic acid transferase [Deltaproteobacteria bacterium]
MFWLYNVLWLLAFPGVILYLALRRSLTGKYRQNLGPRLGVGLKGLTRPIRGEVIWVHALSVGEVLSVVSLVHTLREEFPDHKILITTTTESGQHVARQKLTSLDCHFLYMPLDFWWLMQRTVKSIGASLFVLVETDLWPNLFWCLARAGTPIILVNGRLSNRSFPRYRLWRRFFSRVFNTIDVFSMQSQEDARRVEMLGVEVAKIRVTGNLKFDQPMAKSAAQEREELVRELEWIQPSLTWVAGSTHPGEEDIILRVYSRLRQEFSDFCLILAPRNQQRFEEVFKLASQSGWHTLLRSQLPAGEVRGAQLDVLILDTIGELARFYSLGDFAFVGGSLMPLGGHNPLEAVQCGLPAVFGPHMENFRDIAAILAESGGGFQVEDENELLALLRAWLTKPAAAREQGQKGQRALQLHQGSVARNLEVIRSILENGKA